MINPLNENIKNLRQKEGLTQATFANLLGVTKQCVSNWENDNVQPSIDMLVKIADYFRVSSDFLLGREPMETINVDGLTEEQISHIRLIVKDLLSA